MGVGSGRLTKIIAKSAVDLKGIDSSSEVIENLKRRDVLPAHVQLGVADILNTEGPPSYEAVLFLENGLGNILTEERRAIAVSNMVTLLRPGGRVVLGLRSLSQSPVDHLMIASQDEHFMGVYHTFSKAEARSLFKHCIDGEIEKIIDGEGRPAGGSEFFVIFRRYS